jgi:ABC-type bacteriocin/lantibiotic exporter with double-glycine peptidase domain
MKKIMLKSKPFQGTPFKGWCGPYSLKVVLDYYGFKISEKTLVKLCGTTKKKGTSEKQLKKAVENFGFKVKIQDNSSFGDIASWLKKGVPVIVDWFTRGRNDYDDFDVAGGHYSVAIGLDQKYIYVSDPEIGRIRKIERKDFMSVWFDFPKDYPKKQKDFILRRMIVIYK